MNRSEPWSGSVAVGSECFWASWIGSVIICTDPNPSTNKQEMKKCLDFGWLVTHNDLSSFKTDVNVPKECNKQKKFENILVGFFKSHCLKE
jgi:hypothetical protein